jgi:hypothetical protein
MRADKKMIDNNAFLTILTKRIMLGFFFTKTTMPGENGF